jgi:post-segregation antitoxin (ccd killing protein)
MNDPKMTLPKKTGPLIKVDGRAPRAAVDRLKAAGVNLSALIRAAIEAADRKLTKEPKCKAD